MPGQVCQESEMSAPCLLHFISVAGNSTARIWCGDAMWLPNASPQLGTGRQTQTAQQGGFGTGRCSLKLHFCRQSVNILNELAFHDTQFWKPSSVFLDKFKFKIVFYFSRLKCVVAFVPFFWWHFLYITIKYNKNCNPLNWDCQILAKMFFPRTTLTLRFFLFCLLSYSLFFIWDVTNVSCPFWEKFFFYTVIKSSPFLPPFLWGAGCVSPSVNTIKGSLAEVTAAERPTALPETSSASEKLIQLKQTKGRRNQ